MLIMRIPHWEIQYHGNAEKGNKIPEKDWDGAWLRKRQALRGSTSSKRKYCHVTIRIGIGTVLTAPEPFALYSFMERESNLECWLCLWEKWLATKRLKGNDMPRIFDNLKRDGERVTERDAHA